jgi:hypothetical protein
LASKPTQSQDINKMMLQNEEGSRQTALMRSNPLQLMPPQGTVVSGPSPTSLIEDLTNYILPGNTFFQPAASNPPTSWQLPKVPTGPITDNQNNPLPTNKQVGYTGPPSSTSPAAQPKQPKYMEYLKDRTKHPSFGNK